MSLSRRLAVLMVSGALTSAITFSLAGQSAPGDLIGYVSLHHSPIGLLAPVASRSQLGLTETGVSLALRYAEHGEGNRDNKANAYAATALLPVGTHGSVSLTAGGYKEQCPDPECKNILMLGAGGELNLSPNLFNAPPGTQRVNLGLSGDIGWSARQFETTYLTAAVGLPITMTFSDKPGIHLAPWVTPGVGFGRASISGNVPVDHTQTGTRPMLGAGLALYNPASSISIQAGATHVVGRDSKTVLGINLVLGW
jgi:hypothetical protein